MEMLHLELLELYDNPYKDYEALVVFELLKEIEIDGDYDWDDFEYISQ